VLLLDLPARHARPEQLRALDHPVLAARKPRKYPLNPRIDRPQTTILGLCTPSVLNPRTLRSSASVLGLCGHSPTISPNRADQAETHTNVTLREHPSLKAQVARDYEAPPYVPSDHRFPSGSVTVMSREP
jgi:hypothetical protein